MSYFPSNLEALRLQKEYSPALCADKIGVSASTWQQWELGKEEPNFKQLLAISNFFEVSADILLRNPLKVFQPEFRAKIAGIKVLFLDVDGVMTDAGMYYSESGDYVKKFNAKDGLALMRAQRQGLQVGIISNSSHVGIIEGRAKALEIPRVWAAKGKKIEVARQWLAEMGLSFEQCAYIGDDLNDLEIMAAVGISACPADAARQVKSQVDIILQREGGAGCVREFLEEVLGLKL